MALTQAVPSGTATPCNAPGSGMLCFRRHRSCRRRCWVFPASIVNAFSATDTSFPPGTGPFTAPNAVFPSNGKRPANGFAVTEVGCNGLAKKYVAAQSLFTPRICILVSFVQKPKKRVLVRYRGAFRPISKTGATTTILTQNAPARVFSPQRRSVLFLSKFRRKEYIRG